MELSLVSGYVVISTLVVWLPAGIVLLAGERVEVIFARGQSWLTEHATALRVWLSLGIGSALVVDGLLRLFL